MDGPSATSNESPPSRTTILGSFLRGRPRNSSQSHIQVNTDIHNHHRDISPSSPPQPPSPNPQSSSRRRPGPQSVTALAVSLGTVNTSNNNNNNHAAGSGLNLTNMLRRRRSAGNVAAPTPAPPALTAAATTAAPNVANYRHTQPPGMGGAATSTFTVAGAVGGPSHPTATQMSMANSTAGGVTHRIRLVPHLDTRRSLRFEAIGRDLREGEPPLRIGRFTDRSGLGLAAVNALGSNKLAFKSKVVSRAHAEIWVEAGGKFYVKDTKSSSGTFLNHSRLSAANTESKPHLIKDGDILQLGVDYQGGTEDIYKSVKIRIELNREWQQSANAFNTNALKNLKSLALPVNGNGKQPASVPKMTVSGKTQIPDCCICLFGVTIRQALFIAPCSHTFHYKCIRPLLEAHHPAFSCPLCRTYADLEEDVEVDAEIDEEVEMEEEINTGIEPEAPNLVIPKSNSAINGHTTSGARGVSDIEVDLDVDSPAHSDDAQHQHAGGAGSSGAGGSSSHLHAIAQAMDSGMEDNVPGSRSNSGLAVRERDGAGMETEVEAEGSSMGLVSRMRAGRNATPGRSAHPSSPSDEVSPFADYADDNDEDMVYVNAHAHGPIPAELGGHVPMDADVVGADETIGGKRKH
ncbi:hypothetical protein CVT24_010463 [Panaeolus cyanescens]|uniref:SMAD/FHA domain-containing protein n=1 Tax=Panaeolus cyanescens TaxID=181874 RepID=A0A409W982_9AGAR|nr:hypothetical protein CVT24_010463 [Panaeolus cyanescens]